MTILEYMLAFIGQRSALADQYARESDRYSLLFSAKADEKYAGFFCLIPDSGVLRIAYVYTLPEFRMQGVCTAMMRSVIENTRIPVRTNIVSDHAFHGAVKAVCEKLGFKPKESLQVFTCQRENYPAWVDFMERRGNRLCAYLEHKGCEAVSFKDMDEDLRRQLMESAHSDYKNTMDPSPFLMLEEKNLSWDMSFAAVRDKKLAAYTLVTQMSETKVIFEQISDSAAERGTGCILLPFARAMEAFGNSSCETVSYAMYGSNYHANAFRNKLLNVLNTASVASENYYYHPENLQIDR